jgi:hypothetical protein
MVKLNLLIQSDIAGVFNDIDTCQEYASDEMTANLCFYFRKDSLSFISLSRLPSRILLMGLQR